MKRADENRYTHSATLFHFCKEALNIKHNFEVKVIDQHVGAILGFDPADCSHWKRGKKNIRSIHSINTIAEHLEIDPRLVTDIVSGNIGLEESIQEYKGYGTFESPSESESGSHASPQSEREKSLQIVNEILQTADIRSCPVMIPEVINALSNVTLVNEAPSNGALVDTEFINSTYTIRARPGEMRAHMRFLIAREIGRIFLFPEHKLQRASESVDASLNCFAMLLLMPSQLLQVATREATNTQDLVEQLSSFFWVGRSVVNARIKDFFLNGN